MFKITVDDLTLVSQVVAMSRRFHAEAGEHGPFDAARVSIFLSAVCRERRAAMFVALDGSRVPCGFMVAQCGENYLTGELIAEETAIYVHPNNRRDGIGDELLDCFEDWAFNQMKCKRMRVTAQWSLRMAGVVRWFGRRGFRPVEVSLTKEVVI